MRTPANGFAFVNGPVLCPAGGCSSAFPGAGAPVTSGNYFVSANFFRTRDSLRQDIIDQSQLVRVLSPDPTGSQLANMITTALVGVQFDPTKVNREQITAAMDEEGYPVEVG